MKRTVMLWVMLGWIIALICLCIISACFQHPLPRVPLDVPLPDVGPIMDHPSPGDLAIIKTANSLGWFGGIAAVVAIALGAASFWVPVIPRPAGAIAGLFSVGCLAAQFGLLDYGHQVFEVLWWLMVGGVVIAASWAVWKYVIHWRPAVQVLKNASTSTPEQRVNATYQLRKGLGRRAEKVIDKLLPPGTP